jgi:hypothetical protein
LEHCDNPLSQLVGQGSFGHLPRDRDTNLFQFRRGKPLRQQMAPVPFQYFILRDHLSDAVLDEFLLEEIDEFDATSSR